MGKKKQFINKKNAASFHIIHRTTAPDSAADAASSSLSSLSLSSSAASSTAAAAVSASSSAYYFQPSKADTAIPAGFPVDLLVAQNEAHERAVHRAERRTALQRERDSRDPSLLPHEYDYSAHLREIGGGVFIAAAGAAAYENAASKRERQQREQSQPDVRSQQPAVEDELDREVDWAMVRKAERDGKRKRTRQGVLLAKVPLDVLLALEDDEQRAAAGTEEGQLDELEDDFVLQAMRGSGDTEDEEEDEAEEEKDELDGDDEDDEDDMLSRIKQYEMRDVTVEEDDEDEGGEEWLGDEHDELGEEEEEEEYKGGDDEKGEHQHEQPTVHRRKATAAASEAVKANAADQLPGEQDDEPRGEEQDDDSFWDEDDEDGHEYDDELDDELHPLPSRALDKDFDRLLSEQYGEDDIGGLDDVDESLVSGQLSIDSFADSLDAFLSRQSLPLSQGGSDLSLPSNERDSIKRRMMRRLAAMAAADEGQSADVEGWMSDVYKTVVDDGWDVESVVSTYSNTDNHPTAIREKRSQAALQQSARRKEQAQVALAAAISSAVQPEQHDGQDDEEEDGDGALRNLGVARPRGESAEEKRARKAAWKAEKRESRQRKKQMRTLFASVEHKQQMQQTKASIDNPTGRQLI